MEETVNLEKNVKLYPIYKMFGWDLLFYYAIILLFLVKAKGLTTSQVFFADAFYPLFRIFLQFISIRFSDKFGLRKTILTGNLFVCSGLILVMFCNSIISLIIVNLLFAIGYNFKELCEPSFLNNSIQNMDKKREIFSKTDGNASALFYIFDAVSAATAGFLFVANYYLPIFFSLISAIIGTIISFTFIDTPRNSTVNIKIDKYIKDFKYIFKSKRLRALILFASVFASLLAIFKTYMNSLLIDLDVPEVYFGFITAGIQIIASFSSRKQAYFHKRYRNRTLTFFAIPLSILILTTGFAVAFRFPTIFIYILFIAMVVFYASVKGPYYTLIKRYLNSFVSGSVTTKIYAATTKCDSVFRSLTYLLSSYLLGITTTAYSLIILGSIFTLIFIFILEYMKTRVGLTPEQYSPSDTQIGMKL